MVNIFANPMVKGALIGVGVSAVAFYAYKHNWSRVWTASFRARHTLRRA